MTVFLDVNGVGYGGWQRIRIERSIETISGGFVLNVSERWTDDPINREINKSDRCTVRIDNDVVINGYVDDVNPTFDAQSHGLTVSGRDKAGDLVDCSAVHSPGQWTNLPLERIAQILLAPFGISVSADVDTGENFKKFALEQRETVFDAIQRMCKMRAVLPVSDENGNILITRAGSSPAGTALVEGDNILSGDSHFSDKERFSKIIVKGQSQGSDNITIQETTGAKGVAEDPEITRYRPLLLQAEGQANTKNCQDRAIWERATRKGKGTKATIRVQGWRQGNGRLWQPNSIVPVRSPMLKLNENMLIVSTSFTVDDKNGHVTELTVVKPDAYKLIRENISNE